MTEYLVKRRQVFVFHLLFLHPLGLQRGVLVDVVPV